MMEGMVSSSEGTMVDTANVTFWLRTLLQQNSDLVEVVAKLEAGTRYFTRHFKREKGFETITLFLILSGEMNGGDFDFNVLLKCCHL